MDPRWVDELTGDVKWQKERPWQSGAWVRVDDGSAASKLSDSIKQRLKVQQSAAQVSTSSVGSGAESVLFGAAVGASAALVGFGLKGIWKIIVFPFWLMFWMFKLMFLMFKSLFYTVPKFLWSKGTAGKIGCGVYLFVWSVAIFIESMGKAYVFRNWIYLFIVLLAIIASAATTITFRLLDKRFTKRFAIALFSGIFAVGITLFIGLFFTKHLRPLEGEIIPIEERYKAEEIPSETVEKQIQVE